MGDVHGRQVVVTTSRDRYILSLSKLQERDHDGVNFVVHNDAPRQRLEQKSEQKFCCWVSNGASGGKKQRSHASSSRGEVLGNPYDTTRG